MIRIELRRRARPAVPRFVVVLLVLAVLGSTGAGGLYWLDQRYGLYGVWNHLRRTESGGVQASGQVGSGGGQAAEQAGSGAEVSSANPDLAKVPVAQGNSIAAPAEAADAVDLAGGRDTAATAQAGRQADSSAISARADQRSHPRRGVACQWALRASARLPAGMWLTALTCRENGDFSLEGVSASQQPLVSFLRTLRQLPARVELSWWRSGRVLPGRSANFHFSYQGRLGGLPVGELAPLSVAQSARLAKKIRVWAAAAQLQDVAVDKPLELEHKPGISRRRCKMWATGTYGQIRSFASRFKQIGDVAALGEMVIVPVSAGDAIPSLARLYCALDFLVKH